MRAVIQRVNRASVTIGEDIKGQIGKGLLIFLGVEDEDALEDISWLTGKIARLRIFADEGGVMNLSLKDVGGQALVVSQFTLHASIKKGNRPYYGRSSHPSIAIPLYNSFIEALEKELGQKVATGEFGADMQVALENDGPVTIVMDSKNIE